MTPDEEYGPDTTYCEWLAKTRWGAYIHGIEERAVLAGHAAALPVGRAMEVGCEGGRWCRMLHGFGWHITCTDVNEMWLRICSRRLPDAKCILVTPSQREFPAEDRAIKLFLCVGVPPAIQSESFIREAHRVLEPGGILVGTFWNRVSVRGALQHLQARLRGKPSQYRFSYTKWRRQLKASGFDMFHEEGYCWFPFRRASDSRWVPWAVRMETALRLRELPFFSPWVAFAARKGIG